MTFRLVVKEVAREFDLYATFMPKPIEGLQGSGSTRTCRCSRTSATPSSTRRTSTACRRSAGRSWRACSRTRARSRRSPTSGSTRTSGSFRGSRRRPTCPGARATARRSCGSRSRSAARRLVPDRVPGAGPRVQPRTSRSRSSCPPGLDGVVRELELPARGRPGPARGRGRRPRHGDGPAARHAAPGARGDAGRASSFAGCSATTSSRGSWRTRSRSGRSTRSSVRLEIQAHPPRL